LLELAMDTAGIPLGGEGTTKTSVNLFLLPLGKKGACQALGDRMKAYEQSTNLRLDPTAPWIVRLDGHKFSKFTKRFTRPYDTRIHEAMVETTKMLLKNFNPVAAFTCSDEITHVYPALQPRPGEEIEPVDEKKERKNPQYDLPFGGKVQKISSLMAGFATAHFNACLKAAIANHGEDSKLTEHVEISLPFFDARTHNVPNNAEAFNNVLWRASYDYRRNSIAGLAQHHFTHRELQGLSTKEQMAKLIDEKGIDWNDCPEWYKYGTLLKRESFVLQTAVPSGQNVEAHRTRLVTMPFQLDFSEENVRFLMCKATKA